MRTVSPLAAWPARGERRWVGRPRNLGRRRSATIDCGTHAPIAVDATWKRGGRANEPMKLTGPPSSFCAARSRSWRPGNLSSTFADKKERRHLARLVALNLDEY